MTEHPDLDHLVSAVELAAHNAAIDSVTTNGGSTRAAATSAAVRAAFECAIGNGLITITPPDTWPFGIVIRPPYHATGTQS